MSYNKVMLLQFIFEKIYYKTFASFLQAILTSIPRIKYVFHCKMFFQCKGQLYYLHSYISLNKEILNILKIKMKG